MSSSSYPSGGVAVIAVNAVFTFLAIIAVIGRFYARSLKRRRPTLDDYLIVAGLIFTIATASVGFAMVVDGGVGIHQTEASLSQISILLKLFVPAPMLWSCATTCVKLSILWFYIGIFEWHGFRPAAYVVMAVSIALWVAVILESFLLCSPFEYTWNKVTVTGTCGSSTEAYLSVAIVNLIIDLSIVALPMPILWRLQMSWKKKAAISALLGLGLIVCVMSALRIESVLALQDTDFTYTVVPDLIYGGLEVELGIINACLPIMQPVFNKHFGADGIFSRLRSKITSSNKSESGRNWPSYSDKNANSLPKHRPQRIRDDVYALYPTTTTSYADVDLEQSYAGHDRTGITVTQDLTISRSDKSHDSTISALK